MRPQTLGDYIGQEKVKKQLKITMGAGNKNGKSPLPHMLFYGNPGLGKTTIGKIIANEYDVTFHEVMASSLNTVEDVENVLKEMSEEQPDILLIDEIHRLKTQVEELLYPVMEDMIFEKEVEGLNEQTGVYEKKIQKFWVPDFTLIGATTLAGDLSRPLRDRFGLQFQLQNYDEDEIVSIVRNEADRANVSLLTDAAYEIAKRSKGVARLAINHLYRCKDYADFADKPEIDKDVTDEQFDLSGIDEMGLDESDYKVLEFLSMQTRPIGLGTLATGTDIDEGTIKSIIEPYLVRTHLMNRTRSGRKITGKGLDWVYRNNKENAPVIHEDQPQPETKRVGGLRKVGE